MVFRNNLWDRLGVFSMVSNHEVIAGRQDDRRKGLPAGEPFLFLVGNERRREIRSWKTDRFLVYGIYGEGEAHNSIKCGILVVFAGI